jgi:hypothetical protein
MADFKATSQQESARAAYAKALASRDEAVRYQELNQAVFGHSAPGGSDPQSFNRLKNSPFAIFAAVGFGGKFLVGEIVKSEQQNKIGEANVQLQIARNAVIEADRQAGLFTQASGNEIAPVVGSADTNSQTGSSSQTTKVAEQAAGGDSRGSGGAQLTMPPMGSRDP